MARNKTNQELETQEDSLLSEQQESPMTGRAVGTAIDPSTGTWVAVVLEFNPATGQARVARTVPAGSAKMEAAEKFKILAVEEGVVV